MENPANIGIGILCMMVFSATIAWQFHVWKAWTEKDTSEEDAVFSVILFIPFIFIVWGISATADSVSSVVVYLRYSVACILGLAVGFVGGSPAFAAFEEKRIMSNGGGIVVGVSSLGVSVLSILASIGAIGYGVMTALDPSREIPIEPLISFVLAVVTLSYSFYIKCIFNALLFS